jgi:hypothetical protein
MKCQIDGKVKRDNYCFPVVPRFPGKGIHPEAFKVWLLRGIF